MRNFLYITVGISIVTHLLIKDKADVYKKKASADSRTHEHFDSQRITWERVDGGIIGVGSFAFLLAAFVG